MWHCSGTINGLNIDTDMERENKKKERERERQRYKAMTGGTDESRESKV